MIQGLAINNINEENAEDAGSQGGSEERKQPKNVLIGIDELASEDSSI